MSYSLHVQDLEEELAELDRQYHDLELQKNSWSDNDRKIDAVDMTMLRERLENLGDRVQRTDDEELLMKLCEIVVSARSNGLRGAMKFAEIEVYTVSTKCTLRISQNKSAVYTVFTNRTLCMHRPCDDTTASNITASGAQEIMQ